MNLLDSGVGSSVEIHPTDYSVLQRAKVNINFSEKIIPYQI